MNKKNVWAKSEQFQEISSKKNFNLHSNMCVTHFVCFDLDRHFVCVFDFLLRMKFVCSFFLKHEKNRKYCNIAYKSHVFPEISIFFVLSFGCRRMKRIKRRYQGKRKNKCDEIDHLIDAISNGKKEST